MAAQVLCDYYWWQYRAARRSSFEENEAEVLRFVGKCRGLVTSTKTLVRLQYVMANEATLPVIPCAREPASTTLSGRAMRYCDNRFHKPGRACSW